MRGFEGIRLQEDSDVVDEVINRISILIETIPQLAGPIGKDIVSSPAWRAMQARYQSLRRFRDAGLRPPLVVTLFGPSGAGKSTIFRKLTELPVPAGDIRRPTTYHCLVAVPSQLTRFEFLQDLFPSFQLQKLADPRALTEKNSDADTLFYATSNITGADAGAPLVVADVPDFNTVEEFNWDRAERMLHRAELVVFLVYHEAYADHRCMQQLAQCARLAGDLVYIFTKTSPEAARSTWEDFLKKIEECPYFEGHRQDGQTLREFLRSRWYYFSPRSEKPELADIQPIIPAAPDFSSLFLGSGAQRIILTGFLQSSYQALQESQNILREAKERRKKLLENIGKLQNIVNQSAQTMAQNIFPVGRMLELLQEESRKATFWLLRPVASALGLFDRQLSRFVNGIKNLADRLEKPSRENPEIKELSEAEKPHLERLIEEVIAEIRQTFPEEAGEGGMFSAKNCQEARKLLLQSPVPAPMDHWEQSVREEIQRWIKENRWRAHALTTLGPLLRVGGIGLIVLDLATTGGVLGTTIGPLTGAAGGSLVFSWFMKNQMEWIAKKTQESWVAQRSQEIAQHIETYFLTPLVERWKQTLKELHEDRLRNCEETCRTLDSLLLKGHLVAVTR